MNRKRKNTEQGNTPLPTLVGISDAEEQNCTAIFHDVMRLRGKLKRIATNAAAGLDMKSTEMSIVDTLGKFGPMTMGRVAELSFISTTNSTRAVKNLISDRLVERKRSEHSDREVVVSLTENGRSVFQKSYPRMIHDVNESLSTNLNERERHSLARLLAKAIKEPRQ